MGSLQEIKIVAVGGVSPAILDYLGTILSGSVAQRCTIPGLVIDPADAYNPARTQYHSTHLLGKLLSVDRPNGCKVLGVADVDLFIPILTFVFGEAQLGGQAALMSAHRLRQQFYGLPENDDLFLTRCEKEALHELGHTGGLRHCTDFECVMHFSNSIEQVDLKSGDFCARCEAELGRLI